MELSFGKGALLLLLVAAVVAILTRRFRLPYSVGLVAAGMALALLPLAPKINFTKELIFNGLLPPLLFEAAFYLRWSRLRRELPVILTLASVGVVLAGAVTAMGMHYFAHWQWPNALVFGSLIAATDPVSVIATFREAQVHGRLRLLIEAESLLNDGTAAVAFGVAVTFATGHDLTAIDLTKSLAATVGGALLCGAAVGGMALFLTRHTEGHLVELTFTTVAAYGSFLLAEQFHCSGEGELHQVVFRVPRQKQRHAAHRRSAQQRSAHGRRQALRQVDRREVMPGCKRYSHAERHRRGAIVQQTLRFDQ